MGTNLDGDQRRLIITVTCCVTVLILAFVIYAQLFVFPRLEKLQFVPILENKRSPLGDTPCASNTGLLYGCCKTLCMMAAATFLLTWPITWQRNLYADEDSKTLTSSINFCEADFLHSRRIAEPANTISSITSYIPLALAGILHSGSRTKTKYFICYAAIFMIGVGSSLLHAFLDAVTQGGDELPMLWYSAAASYCVFDVIFSGVKGLGSLVFLTALISTLVYAQFRDNFSYFYINFTSYCATLILSLTYVSFFMDWEKRPDGAVFKERILLPLVQTCAYLTVAAIWIWVVEMIGCSFATNQGESTWFWLLWNSVLHPLWHFLTSILAFMLIQVMYAAEGFSQAQEIPRVAWSGVPYIVFEDPDKTE